MSIDMVISIYQKHISEVIELLLDMASSHL
jgi:hypothetical protein